MKTSNLLPRRDFLKSSTVISAGAFGILPFIQPGFESEHQGKDQINVFGPRDGFSPHIGTLLSMMTWMRDVILRPVKNMSTEELDFLLDKNSNSIGAMLYHLAATERYYQIHTFEGKKWGKWSETDKKRWDIAMNLGDEARKTIKGKPYSFYLDLLTEVRENTISEFKKRDDSWLFAIDEAWYWGPTNNYCKWFHVCEHESNHNGQFKYIKSRLPGAKWSRE